MSNSRHQEPSVRFWILDHHRGERWGFPPTDWSVLVYSARGTLRVRSSDHYWVLPPTRGLWLPSGLGVQGETVAAAEVRSLYFPEDRAPHRAPGPLEITPLLRHLILAACERGPLYTEKEDHRALADLLRHEIEAAPGLPVGLSWPQSDWLRDLADRLVARPDAGVGGCGYSRRSVERAMLRETGLSLGRWVRRARMLRALSSLGEGHSVSVAADAAGYRETSAFVHAFRREFGVTPARVRAELRPTDA